MINQQKIKNKNIKKKKEKKRNPFQIYFLIKIRVTSEDKGADAQVEQNNNEIIQTPPSLVVEEKIEESKKEEPSQETRPILIQKPHPVENSHVTPVEEKQKDNAAPLEKITQVVVEKEKERENEKEKEKEKETEKEKENAAPNGTATIIKRQTIISLIEV